MLKHSEARSIAESAWGTGGTHSYPVRESGAYYFSCSGHGGFVVDAEALTIEEKEALKPYITPDKYTRYSWNGKNRLMHAYKTRGIRVSTMAEKTEGEFYLFEEDCDWALIYVFTGIRLREEKIDVMEHARSTFERWHAGKATANGCN